MSAIEGFLQTTRFAKSFAGSVLLFLASGSFEYAVASLMFFAFSFAFNDFVDAGRDLVGHPDRAIPGGKLTRQQGLLVSLVLLIAGIMWNAIYLGDFILGFATIYFLSFMYSILLKPHIPVIATPVWSLAVTILFLQPFLSDILVYIAFAIIVFGYETLLDVRDKLADKQFGSTPTLAFLLGNFAYVFSIAMIATGSAILLTVSLT